MKVSVLTTFSALSLQLHKNEQLMYKQNIIAERLLHFKTWLKIKCASVAEYPQHSLFHIPLAERRTESGDAAKSCCNPDNSVAGLVLGKAVLTPWGSNKGQVLPVAGEPGRKLGAFVPAWALWAGQPGDGSQDQPGQVHGDETRLKTNQKYGSGSGVVIVIWVRHSPVVTRQAVEWSGLEAALKVASFQPLCHRQGHLPLGQIAQSPIQSGLEHFHWGITKQEYWTRQVPGQARKPGAWLWQSWMENQHSCSSAPARSNSLDQNSEPTSRGQGTQVRLGQDCQCPHSLDSNSHSPQTRYVLTPESSEGWEGFSWCRLLVDNFMDTQPGQGEWPGKEP